MKQLRIVTLMLALLCASVFSAGCGSYQESHLDSKIAALNIGPANPTRDAGGTLQFNAQLTEVNGSQYLINNLVQWSSSNVAVATINPVTGLATAVAPGQTIITAVGPNGFSASTTFTVTP